MEYLGALLIMIGIIVVLYGIYFSITEESLLYFIIIIIITIVLIVSGVGCIKSDFKHANEDFKYAIEHQHYEKVRTFVEGIYKDKIETKEGTFNVTKYSKFKNVLDLKIDEVITITYINEKYGVKHIIDINRE
jgi:dipeptide/tripeptide permease